MLRTGSVLLRHTTFTSPSSRVDGESGVRDGHGQRAVLVQPAEGDLLAGDHDDPGVRHSPLDPDRLAEGRGGGPAGPTPRSRWTCSGVSGLGQVRSSSQLSRS
jgi:hypothetical protein